MRYLTSFLTFALATAPLLATALDEQTLAVIDRAGNIVCGEFAREGSENTTRIEGEAQAELNGLVRHLVDLGLEGAGEIASNEYRGVLRTELGAELRDIRKCRTAVFEKIIAPAVGDPTAQPPASETEVPSIHKIDGIVGESALFGKLELDRRCNLTGNVQFLGHPTRREHAIEGFVNQDAIEFALILEGANISGVRMERFEGHIVEAGTRMIGSYNELQFDVKVRPILEPCNPQ